MIWFSEGIPIRVISIDSFSTFHSNWHALETGPVRRPEKSWEFLCDLNTYLGFPPVLRSQIFNEAPSSLDPETR